MRPSPLASNLSGEEGVEASKMKNEIIYHESIHAHGWVFWRCSLPRRINNRCVRRSAWGRVITPDATTAHSSKPG